jgi:hypothetical protein
MAQVRVRLNMAASDQWFVRMDLTANALIQVAILEMAIFV